jgi:integrase
MAKRANGEGNVYQRANGTWEARMTYIDPDTGRRRRVSFYAKTAKAARAEMKKARDRVDAGAPVKDASTTVGDWLSHWRATTLAVSDRKESTRTLYDLLARRYLEPAPFGATPLDKLRPSDVEALILRLRAKTKPGRPDPDSDAEPAPVRALSDSTIRSTYTVLRSALDGAVRDGLLARNPAAQVRRPGVERTEAHHLDADAVTAVLRAAETSRYHPALVLIASTGMRKGEALALSWDRVDLDAGVLRVAATISRIGGRLVITEPKTDRARRTVPIPPRSPRCCGNTRRARPPNGCARRTNGRTRAWCSPLNSAGRSIRGTCCGLSRWRRGRRRSMVSACTRCGIRRRLRGWSRVCTSEPWPTCLGTRRSPSPATSTATHRTTPRGRPSTHWPDASG